MPGGGPTVEEGDNTVKGEGGAKEEGASEPQYNSPASQTSVSEEVGPSPGYPLLELNNFVQHCAFSHSGIGKPRRTLSHSQQCPIAAEYAEEFRT